MSEPKEIPCERCRKVMVKNLYWEDDTDWIYCFDCFDVIMQEREKTRIMELEQEKK